jgi:hypothetical protein
VERGGGLVSAPTFRVTIAIEHAALADDQPGELGRILVDLGQRITAGTMPAIVRDSNGNHVGDVELTEGTEAGTLPLELCVCGECYDCPDGWHRGEDLPCSCTPDCALGDACPDDPDGLHHVGCGCDQ